MTITLTDAEHAKLTEANRLLTELTESHSHNCICLLCEARWMTDVQDAGSRIIEAVTPIEAS